MEEKEARLNPFHRIYHRLLDYYGHQDWWPGETPFEVMVGAILTQNTAWTNVEKAINNLKRANSLSADQIMAISVEELADLIRSAGYFNVKARRLKNFCDWYLFQGGYEQLAKWPTDALRKSLLSVNGIGPETADDILLYVFERPIFVIDAYTRRLFLRLGLIEPDLGYEELRRIFESELEKNTQLYNEYHALIVNHAKSFCKTRPVCETCILNDHCPGKE